MVIFNYNRITVHIIQKRGINSLEVHMMSFFITEITISRIQKVNDSTRESINHIRQNFYSKIVVD